jgi:hypothetical protein
MTATYFKQLFPKSDGSLKKSTKRQSRLLEGHSNEVTI